MKLYHATEAANTTYIKENGIEPMTKDEARCADQILDLCGVYGFVDIEDAHDFAIENNWSEDYVIFCFDVDEDETVIDPEYDGESLFVETDDNITAELVFDEFGEITDVEL